MKVQRIIASAALAIVFASALPAQRQQGPSGAPPDFIYYNAKVVTVDDQFSYAQGSRSLVISSLLSVPTTRYASSQARTRNSSICVG